MQVGKLLLDNLVELWDVDMEAFVVYGERIGLTLYDIYFLIELPMDGVVRDI